MTKYFLADCLKKIDFSVKGPFGTIGPKLKQQIEIARIQMLSGKLAKSEVSTQEKTTEKKNLIRKKITVNTNYYSLKVPGS